MKTRSSTLLFLVLLLLVVPLASAVGTGGTITTDGEYTIHTFTSSDTFNWTGASVDSSILILAGGGGGGYGRAGGGGAGGLFYNTSFPLTAGTHTVNVGIAGIAGTSDTVNGGNGTNSSFDTFIMKGGGGGASVDMTPAPSGGAGGGAGSSASSKGGAGIIPFGYGGANGSQLTTKYPGGGGGGSSSYGFPGIASGNTAGGIGGQGTNLSISGSIICYGGGGAGGAYSETAGETIIQGVDGCRSGGLGGTCRNSGGVVGSASVAPTSYGTGGSGGGRNQCGTNDGTGGTGGIVIIRYLTPSLGPTISFLEETSNNGDVYFNEKRTNIYANIITNNLEGDANSTIYLYNASGLYASITNTTNTNFSYNFSSLNAGTYYLNASVTNGTNVLITETRTIYIYSLTNNGIIIPINEGSQNSEYMNISWNETTIDPPASGVTISSYNITLYNVSGIVRILNITTDNHYYWNVYNENLSIGEYSIRITSIDSNGNFSIQNSNFSLLSNAILNVSAIYARDNSSITNFTINITNRLDDSTETKSTTLGYLLLDIVKEHNYALTLDAEGYALTSINYTSNNMTYQNVTLSAYTENSVFITIYNENTFLLVTENITVTFSSGGSEIIRYTANGSLYEDSLADGPWSIKFVGDNYTTKTYAITVENRSFQYLNAYISSSYQTFIITIQDSATSSTIEGASITMERLINSTWTIVESKLSDITGRAQFSYLPAIKYKFTVGLTGYTSKVFYLDPIIFSTYTVNIDPELDYSSESDYSDLQIALYPRLFYNNRTNNVTFIISSPTGKLTNYTIEITAPGGSAYDTGNLANGESFILPFNISGATIFDRVNINYSYVTTDASRKTYNFRYTILGPGSVANYTISQAITEDYGMGMFEKAILAFLAVVVLSGFAFMALGIGGALFVGLLAEGVAVYLGLLPLASVIISMLLGTVIIISSGMGGKS